MGCYIGASATHACAVTVVYASCWLLLLDFFDIEIDLNDHGTIQHASCSLPWPIDYCYLFFISLLQSLSHSVCHSWHDWHCFPYPVVCSQHYHSPPCICKGQETLGVWFFAEFFCSGFYIWSNCFSWVCITLCRINTRCECDLPRLCMNCQNFLRSSLHSASNILFLWTCIHFVVIMILCYSNPTA